MAAAVLVCGCARGFHPPGHAVPAPAGALAAAPLSGNRVAVLAGTAEAKGVFIIDAGTGQVSHSFGVTKEATGLTAATNTGPILLSIGGDGAGSHFGAIEEWSLDGIKQRVVPLPTAGLGLTVVSRNRSYVLLGADGDVRAAMPLAVRSLRVGRAIPLEAGAKSLQLCQAPLGDFLLYTGAKKGLLKMRWIRNGIETSSSVAASGAVCATARQVAYAIVGGPLNRSVSALSIPALLPMFAMPASNDAIALYETADGHLMSLNSTPRAASIEVFRDEQVAAAEGQSAWADARSQ